MGGKTSSTLSGLAVRVATIGHTVVCAVVLPI